MMFLGLGILLLFFGVVATSLAIVSKAKKLLLLFIPPSVSGLLMMIGSSNSATSTDEISVLTTLGIVTFIVYIIVLLYGFVRYGKQEKIPVKKEETLPLKVKKYCDNKETLLKEYEENINYPILKEALDKLPSAYNLYASELLGVTKLPKSSLDPAVAAALGNTIGGFPCGVAMGLSAIEKKEYRKNQLKEFDKKYSNINNKEKKVIYLINTIENILNQQ